MSNQRKLAIALMVSLMLNAFCLGTLVNKGPSEQPREMHPAWAQPRPEVAQLSDHAREMLQQMRQQRRQSMQAQFQALQVARTAVRDAFVAIPFDEQALQAAFAQLRTAESALSARAQAGIIELAQKIDAEERQLLAERIVTRASRLAKPMRGMRVDSESSVGEQ